MLKVDLPHFNSQEARTHTPEPILLVDTDPTLRHSRAMLLSTFNIPVQNLACYTEVWRLPDSASFSLVLLIHRKEAHDDESARQSSEVIHA